eukprot:4916442-Amphidinium_carterae.1
MTGTRLNFDWHHGPLMAYPVGGLLSETLTANLLGGELQTCFHVQDLTHILAFERRTPQMCKNREGSSQVQ